MERFITDELIKWKNSKNRKPLILKGARQVGKTYILKDFGKTNYENVAYFNFDHDEGLALLFQNTKDPYRIIEQLSLVNGKKISPNTTLIIFDEIQECPNALNSLKYFCEEAPMYHVACAGSLLGIRLSKSSFPVGKVDFLNLFPMTFSEFLIADNALNLVQVMREITEVKEIPKVFEDKLIEKLKVYYIIGGMPEAVYSWVNDKDIEQVNKIQKNILDSYENDFSKHTIASEANKISLIWNSIPSQLAKENKKNLDAKLNNSGFASDKYLKTNSNGEIIVGEKPNYTYEEVGALSKDTHIPSALSEMTDDENHRIVTDKEKSTWTAKSDFSGSYNDLTDTPEIKQLTDELKEKYDKASDLSKTNESAITKKLNKSGYTGNKWLQTDSSGNIIVGDKPVYIPSDIGAATSDHNHDTKYGSKDAEHTHENKKLLDGITEDLIDSWNNKSTLSVSVTEDGILKFTI